MWVGKRTYGPFSTYEVLLFLDVFYLIAPAILSFLQHSFILGFRVRRSDLFCRRGMGSYVKFTPSADPSAPFLFQRLRRFSFFSRLLLFCRNGRKINLVFFPASSGGYFFSRRYFFLFCFPAPSVFFFFYFCVVGFFFFWWVSPDNFKLGFWPL